MFRPAGSTQEVPTGTTSVATVNPMQPSSTQRADDRWKSDAFINLYLPSKKGGRRKLGAIGLKATKPSEADLINWLKEDPSRVGQVLAKLEIDFQMAEGDPEAGFDLGD